jgi:hypothetical protein
MKLCGGVEVPFHAVHVTKILTWPSRTRSQDKITNRYEIWDTNSEKNCIETAPV